jgi:2-keto-4-pentenoate hydratase/2-oxohepta-3-ene-1,7-dioic acid hydratase in catechol pathway
MKIICIGRNYIDHAKELNNPVPKEPVFFMKPDTSLLINNKPFFYPPFTSDLHHEVELVVQINKVGKTIDKKFAHRYYKEIGIGIDFTARDLQQKAKEKGLPWEIAKGFEGSAPISKFVLLTSLDNPENIPFHLDINGKTVQTGQSADMIFSIDEIISYVSRFFPLKTGDLIFTGTPAGVGPVQVNDRLQAYIGDKLMLDFKVK